MSLPTFDLQAQDVVQQCLISPERRKRVNAVVSDVRILLRHIIPDNYPMIYGSMATGLAFETSDIDCFINSQMIPDGRERVQVLLKNYRVLYRRGAFQDVLRIPNARVPLVKAVHSRTGIEIDISCTSEAALHNTRLIRILADTDVRIRQLIVLISLCYRLNGISGTHRFVSYTIVLLAFFYLQNLETPMLPPLHKVVHSGDDGFASDFHNKGTEDLIVQRHLQAPNNSNLAELFSGFFKFYDSFDFGKNVVSTYMGHAIPIECFSLPDKLPEPLFSLKQHYYVDPSRRNNFLNKFVCVQDPLEQYINTTSYVQLKTLDHFKLVNSYMVNMMRNSAETMWLENMMKMPDEISFSDLPGKNLKPNPVMEFSVSYPNESVNQEEWLSKLKKDLMAVFQLLLFDVVEVSKEPETKVRISEGPVHNRNVMAFELISFFNVFTKRFKGLPVAVIGNPWAFKSGCDELLKISEQMKKPASSFHCELSLKQPISPEDIPVTVRDLNDKPANTYLHIAQMLKKHLTGLLAAASKSEKPPPEESVTVPVPVLKKANVKFTIACKKGESEEEEDWKNRLKIDLISLFEFLLLEHKDLTAAWPILNADDEPTIFAFDLKSSYNIFTKRYSDSYTRVLDDSSSLPTVMAENEVTRSNFSATGSPTFHCELVLTRSECLAPHQLFVALYDVNQNIRNNFAHFSSMLLQNFGGLLNSVKTYRESQCVADPQDNKGDSQVT